MKMDIKVEKTSDYDGYSIEVKRFYIPFKITWVCPRCKTKNEENFNGEGWEYLMYPEINKPFEHSLYCPICDENDDECNDKVILRMGLSLELVEVKENES